VWYNCGKNYVKTYDFWQQMCYIDIGLDHKGIAF